MHLLVQHLVLSMVSNSERRLDIGSVRPLERQLAIESVH